jgi:NADH-quinone oxidoreductase subunit A
VMLAQYGHVFLFLVMGALFPLITLGFASLVRFSSRDKIQTIPYECGYEPIGSAYVPINIRFYLFALIFILFDVESLYLLPWALVFKTLGWMGVAEMGIFMMVLMVGLIYVWKRGALRWGI